MATKTEIYSPWLAVDGGALAIKFGWPNLAAWQLWNDLKADGVYGPISHALMTERLSGCGCRDVDAAMDAAIGVGSWQMPCQKEGVTFSVAGMSSVPESILGIWPRAKAAVIVAWANVGCRLREKPLGERVNITVQWVRPSGGWIGLAEFNNQVCNDVVYCKISRNYTPPNLFDQIARLFCHELGHNCNLPHTRGGIMNPVILSGPFRGWSEDDPSWERIVRYFGGEPLDPPAPPPRPPSGKVIGRITVPTAIAAGDVLVLTTDGDDEIPI